MSVDRTLTTPAKILSVILHPALAPAYLMLILMGYGLLLPYGTFQAKMYFAIVIILNTVVVPGVCMFLFNRIRFWRENQNIDFHKRILPLAVMIVCYGACLIMIRDVPLALIARKILTAGLLCMLFDLTVSFFWRISLYMTAQGIVVAFTGVIVMAGATVMLPALCVSIALAAMLASARLYMGVHDPAQIGAGFGAGLVITTLAIYLI